MPRRHIDATTDAECVEFLKDLELLCERAWQLRKRFDAESHAIGRFWSVNDSIRNATDRAREIIRPE